MRLYKPQEAQHQSCNFPIRGRYVSQRLLDGSILRVLQLGGKEWIEHYKCQRLERGKRRSHRLQENISNASKRAMSHLWDMRRRSSLDRDCISMVISLLRRFLLQQLWRSTRWRNSLCHYVLLNKDRHPRLEHRPWDCTSACTWKRRLNIVEYIYSQEGKNMFYIYHQTLEVGKLDWHWSKVGKSLSVLRLRCCSTYTANPLHRCGPQCRDSMSLQFLFHHISQSDTAQTSTAMRTGTECQYASLSINSLRKYTIDLTFDH